MTAWSYSSIKTFDQCPKKYYHLKVAKDVKDDAGPAAQYGTDLHLAAEEFIRDGKPIPAKFSFVQPVLDVIAGMSGEKHTEMKLGIRKTEYGYEPCEFFAKDVWWRGIVDLLVIDGNTAHMIDYKTGKNAKYADMKQLDLMAGAIFVHFPQVMRIKSGLAYVVSNEFPRKTHVATEKSMYLEVFDNELDRLDHALASGVWNAKTGPLCGWCAVKSCEHYRPPRRK
jgi:hypothetical protein